VKTKYPQPLELPLRTIRALHTYIWWSPRNCIYFTSIPTMASLLRMLDPVALRKPPLNLLRSLILLEAPALYNFYLKHGRCPTRTDPFVDQSTTFFLLWDEQTVTKATEHGVQYTSTQRH
jgi:hypothetical protein